MTWLNPAAFGFLAFIPVIILLHSLRYRRREVRVSTLFLWDSVVREVHGSLGLRRLVQNLPLILQLFLVCVLSAILANPVLTTAVTDSKDVVLILDISASMQTRTPQGNTRFAEAQQTALEVLRTLPAGRQMALIAAGRQPQVLSFFTAEKDLLRQEIMQIQASDAPGNMREAVLLGLSFTQGSGTHEVVIIGDGAYGSLVDLALPRGQIRHIPIVGGEVNVGITRLALRPLIASEDRHEVLIAVKNFSSQPMNFPLQVSVLRRKLVEQRLQLQPGQEETIVSSVSGAIKGVVQAEITVDDDLPLDNRAYGVVATQSQTWILLVGETNYFLETLLTSLPGVLVNVAPQVSEETLPRLLEANQLIIFNGVQPPPLRRGNFLLLNTTLSDTRLSTSGTVARPQVLDWQRDHALLQFVDLTDLVVEEALVVQPQGGAQSIVDGTGTSLMSVIEDTHLRLVHVAFDLMRSDLPVRVAFPVLMHNILHWLNPVQDDFAASQLQAGQPYVLFFDAPVTQVSVQDPQGKQHDYAVSGNPWVFTDTQRSGVYIFRAGDFKRYLTVSLLDETESNINPVDKLPALTPEPGVPVAQRAGVITTPLWLYGLLGAVLVLLGEWYVWCRDF